MAKKKPVELADLAQDPENRRRRTARGKQMLATSLRAVGAGRSIVIDEENQILAGNGVVEEALAAGMTKLQVVETDGQTIVAVRRTNLTPEQKRQLAMFDNRVGELAEWEPDQIAADVANRHELSMFFTEAELKAQLKGRDPKALTVEEVQTSEVADKFWITVRGPLKAQAKALLRLRELLGELDGVAVELGTTNIEEMESM